MSRFSTHAARRSLLHTALFRVASQAATLASYVVLVRGMVEQDFGVLNILYAIIPVVGTIASLGIEQTLRRFQPEYLGSGQTALAAWLARVASLARAATNLVFLGVVLLAWSTLAPVFKIGPYRAEFLVFSVLILLHFQAGVLQLSLSSHMLHRFSIGMLVVPALVKLAGYSALSLQGSLTVMNAILVDASGYALMYAGLWIAHRRHCTPRPAPPLSLAVPPTEKRRLVRYGLFNNFNDAGTLLLSSQADSFFVAALMSPVAVGAYAFYRRINEMAEQVLPIRQFNSVVHPMLFSVQREEAPWRLPRYFTFLVNVTLCVHLPILAFFAACHAQLVDVVFAGKFSGDSALLPVIAAFAVLNCIGEPASLIAQYRERNAVILISKVFAMANIAGMFVMIPSFGIFGAAISTGASMFAKNFYIWWHVRDAARWSNLGNVVVMSGVVWGGCVGASIGLGSVLALHPVGHMAISAALCAIAAWLYARSSALTPSDRELLGKLLGGRAASLAARLGLV